MKQTVELVCAVNGKEEFFRFVLNSVEFDDFVDEFTNDLREALASGRDFMVRVPNSRCLLIGSDAMRNTTFYFKVVQDAKDV